MTTIEPAERHVIELALLWSKARREYAVDEPIKQQSFWMAVHDLERKIGEERTQNER